MLAVPLAEPGLACEVTASKRAGCSYVPGPAFFYTSSGGEVVPNKRFTLTFFCIQSQYEQPNSVPSLSALLGGGQGIT